MQFDRKCGGLLMIRSSVIVLKPANKSQQSNWKQTQTHVQISLQTSPTPTLRIPSIHARLLIIPTARIPCRPMLRPRTRTHPTSCTSCGYQTSVSIKRRITSRENEKTTCTPPFFSNVLSDPLVWLLIQFAVSLSSRNFFNHILAAPHMIGR